MTATSAPPTAVRHPLSRLTAGEIDAVRELVAPTLTGTTRFVHVALEEPDKADVLDGAPQKAHSAAAPYGTLRRP